MFPLKYSDILANDNSVVGLSELWESGRLRHVSSNCSWEKKMHRLPQLSWESQTVKDIEVKSSGESHFWFPFS